MLRDTYQWLLIPTQPEAQGGIEWKETRLQGQDSLVVQASRKATHEGDLLPVYSGTNLRRDALDPYLWRDRNHIDLKQLWEYLTQYLYLPRLKNADVLLQSVRESVARTDWADSFAYSEGFDEKTGQYLGLQAGTGINPSISANSLLVKPEVAQKSFDKEERKEKREHTPLPPPSSSLTPPPPSVFRHCGD